MITTRCLPQALAVVVILGAFNPNNPYGYYILLRWVCCGLFAYLAVQAVKGQKEAWAWILGVTAGIYNPVVPVHLTRSLWIVVNLITVGIALGSVFALGKDTQHPAATPD